MTPLEDLQALVGYHFQKPALLREALTHKSYVFEKKVELADNQRLEFFGDAVLEMISTEYLFDRYPEAGEGLLTKMRSAMTRGDALYSLASSFGLDSYLYLGKGERKLVGKNQQTRVIDAFEALVGAIYIDAGLAEARRFYLRLVEESWQDIYELMLTQNPKGSLQELTQESVSARPEYRLRSVGGREHEPVYEVEVLLNGEVLGVGLAGSRKKAEELAAHEAFVRLSGR
jgi:ribonuclease-3